MIAAEAIKLEFASPPKAAETDAAALLLTRRQLQAYASIAPIAAAGNIFNALVIYGFAYSAASAPLLEIWLAVLASVSLFRVRSSRAFNRESSSAECGNAFRTIVAMSWIMGGSWGVVIAWMLMVPPTTPLIPAMVAAGMMSAAASTLSVMPRAAFAFIAPIAVGGAVGFDAAAINSGRLYGCCAADLLLLRSVPLGGGVLRKFRRARAQ